MSEWTWIDIDGSRVLLDTIEPISPLSELTLDGLSPTEAYAWRMELEWIGLWVNVWPFRTP